MEYREELRENGFLYRIVPDGIEIVYAPTKENRVVIPPMMADKAVVALAKDYHDDLQGTAGAVMALPHTLRRIPAGILCHGCRIEIEGDNPLFYTDGHALFMRESGQAVTLHSFYDDRAVEYDVPAGVTRVGDYAFAYASVEMATLPDSVREIGEHAFFGSALSLLDMPEEGVERIGRCAFANTLLESVRLPRTLRVIEQDCFAKSRLADADIPEGIEEIAENAFEETCLQSVHLPKSLRALSDTAFCGCEALKEIRIEDGNPHLALLDGAVLNEGQTRVLAWPAGRVCEELILPQRVTDIGMAFCASCGIGTLRITGCLDELKEGALRARIGRVIFEQEPVVVKKDAISPLHGEGMEIVVSMRSPLPVHADAPGISYVFADADDAFRAALEKYRFGYEDGGYTIMGCMDWQERLEIPQQISGTPVLRIAGHAFSEKRNGIYPVEIAIPEGVVELRRAAFFWIADSVRQIELPASIQIISDGIFEDVDGRYRDLFLHRDIAFITVAGSPADVFLRAYRRQKDDPRGEELIVISRETEFVPEVIEEEPEVIGEEPEAIEEEPKMIEEEPEAIEEEPEITEEEPEITEEEPEVIEEEPEIIEEEPEIIEEEPEVIEEEPEIIEEEPEVIEEEPEIIEEAPEVIEEEPEIIEEKPEMIEEEPEVIEAGAEETEPAAISGGAARVPAVLPAYAEKENDEDWKISRKKGLVVRYQGREKRLVYPAQVDDVRLTGIADAKKGKKSKAFRKITEVAIPMGYTSIGDYAFAGCKELRIVKLPSTMKTIGKNAFAGCKKLRKVELPESVKSVGKGAFRDSGVKSLVVRGRKLRIKKNAIKGCGKVYVYAPFGAEAFKSFPKKARSIIEMDE